MLISGRNPGLVALEIDNPQLALMTAADEPHGHVAGIAAPPVRAWAHQRLVRMPRRNVVVDDRRAGSATSASSSYVLIAIKSAFSS